MAFNFEVRVTKETEVVKRLPVVLMELESRGMMTGLRELMEKMYDECENSREHGFRDCLKVITGVVSKDKTVQEVWLLKEKERLSRRSSPTPHSCHPATKGSPLVLDLHALDVQQPHFESQKSLLTRISDSGRTTTRSSTNSHQSAPNHHTPPQTIIPPDSHEMPGKKAGKRTLTDQEIRSETAGRHDRNGSLTTRPSEVRGSNVIIDPASTDRSPVSHRVPNYVFTFS